MFPFKANDVTMSSYNLIGLGALLYVQVCYALVHLNSHYSVQLLVVILSLIRKVKTTTLNGS